MVFLFETSGSSKEFVRLDIYESYLTRTSDRELLLNNQVIILIREHIFSLIDLSDCGSAEMPRPRAVFLAALAGLALYKQDKSEVR